MAMTKANKQFLRYLVKNHPDKSDEYMADECECALTTVRKYRKRLNPEGTKP